MSSADIDQNEANVTSTGHEYSTAQPGTDAALQWKRAAKRWRKVAKNGWAMRAREHGVLREAGVHITLNGQVRLDLPVSPLISALTPPPADPTLDVLRWVILRGGLKVPGFDHWRERSTSKPSDPDDIRWDCVCGYAGSPESVERHWVAILAARLAASPEGADRE